MDEGDDPPPYTPPPQELDKGPAIVYCPAPDSNEASVKLMKGEPESPEIELIDSEIIQLPPCHDEQGVQMNGKHKEVTVNLYRPISDDALDDPPTDYLCGSVLVTIFCCAATGAIAIIFSVLAEIAVRREKNMRKGHQYTRIASVFVKLSVCLGIVTAILAVILTLVNQGII